MDLSPWPKYLSALKTNFSSFFVCMCWALFSLVCLQFSFSLIQLLFLFWCCGGCWNLVFEFYLLFSKAICINHKQCSAVVFFFVLYCHIVVLPLFFSHARAPDVKMLQMSMAKIKSCVCVAYFIYFIHVANSTHTHQMW